MSCWFFFGSLLDREVLEIVLGRRPDESAHRRGILSGHQKCCVAGESYPALRPAPGTEACGELVSGLSPLELQRICFFEGDEFELRSLSVRDATGDRSLVKALTFMATEQLQLSDTIWHLDDWQRAHKAGFLPMARDWMAGFGSVNPAALEDRWQAALHGLHNDHSS